MRLAAVADGEYLTLVALEERLLKLRLLYLTYPNRPHHRFGIATSPAARDGSAVAGLEDYGGAGPGAPVLGIVDGGRNARVSVGHPTARSVFFLVQTDLAPPHLPSVLSCLFCLAVGYSYEAPFAPGLVSHFADSPLRAFGNIEEVLVGFHLIADGLHGCVYHFDHFHFCSEVGSACCSGRCRAIRRRD